MAGYRGSGGRSRDDLFSAAESVSEMLAQLKGVSGRGNRRGGGPPHQAQWTLPSYQESRVSAGQREFIGRIPDDQYDMEDQCYMEEEEESDDEMFAQSDTMKDTSHHGGTREADYPQQTQWNYEPSSKQEWDKRPRNPEEAWQRGRGQRRPGAERYPRNPYMPAGNPYPPDPLEMELPRELPHRGRGRGRQQNRGNPRQQPPPEQRRPGPDRYPRNPYMPARNPYQQDPSAQEMKFPREPLYRGRGQRQNRGNQRQQPQTGPIAPRITVQQLVTVLTQTPNFSISLLDLLEHHDLPSRQVKGVIAHYGHMFQMQDEVVSFTPRLKLCAAYSSSGGCRKRDVCDSLHMCPKYVLGWCNEKETCVLGHRWHTDHNLAILKRLNLEYLKYRVLHDLIKKRQKEEQHAAGPLDVCLAYNDDGCDQLQCPSLHVCLSFVVGLTNCTRDNCQLNHDLLSPACCHLLKLHHQSVNESQRDVAMALLQANPGIKDKPPNRPTVKAAAQGQARKGSINKDLRQPDHKKNKGPQKSNSQESSSSASETKSETDDSGGKGKNRRGVKQSHVFKAKAGHSPEKRVSDSSSDSSGTETDSEDAGSPPDKGSGRDNTTKPLPKHQQKDNASVRPKLQQVPKPIPRRTLWAHYLHGDVANPQICYYSVETMCRDEESGCPKLHATNHFHWQVKAQDGRWINLRPDQLTCIERAFCDPALDDVTLPRLDPSKLEASVSGLFLLLGRDIWQADFSTNTLINSTKSKTLMLRRLCTEPIAGKPIKASTHHWYFLDVNKKWVEYGNVDTAGKQDLVSSVTSANIENHYLKTPQQPFTFTNSRFTYVLDLVSMKQTNQSTNVSREVRRRPEPHLPQEKDKVIKTPSDLPPHWDTMQSEEHSRIVPLGPSSDEYKKVVALLGTKVTADRVVKIDRIQNPFMWRALQNKIKEMTALYKSEAAVNVKQLFHGTSHNVVASICKENFDWRLHGTSTGQACGRGTYFGTDAGISYGYCRADPTGLKHMFVARVAVGSMIQGNSSMARPPINPATSMPYDSTVDSTINPSMIIKYSTQEYYPEYLLTLY